MATKKLNKENDMICNGGVPPQIIQGMEMYQSYMQGMMHFYRAWCYMTGMTYWSDQLKDYYKHDIEKREDE